MVKLHKELLIAAIVLTLGSAAAAEGWRGGVAGPRPGLPSVEIVLGYPGGYVPRSNAPIEIRARSGEQAFDGHIGYHIAVGENMTVDVPVVARAVIPPRSEWSFSTTLQIARAPTSYDAAYLTKRELVVDWLDANLTPIAHRTVGVPPWVETPRPMRIVWPDEQLIVSTYLGRPPAVIEVASLSTVPQWYAGFSDVVVPFARWLELPPAVREAIFRSGVHVVFFGIPDRVPAMSAIDRALLPIDLRPTASRVGVPWPYGDGQIAAAVSWRARKGARIAGSSESPYLVTNDVATFAAEEKAILGDLPSVTFSMPMERSGAVEKARPTAAELLREHRPTIVFIIAILLSVATWIAFRRTPRAVVLAASLIAALAIIGWRSAIHAREDTHRLERRAIVAPGVVYASIVRKDYGALPRSVAPEEAAAEAQRVTRRIGPRVGGDTERRTAQTPPGFGEIAAPNRAWLMTTRLSAWRELGEPAAIRIRSRDKNRLVVEYRSKESFNYVTAEWAWNGVLHYGEAPIDAGKTEVTIRNARDVWPLLGSTTTGRTRVVLMRVERGRTVAVREIDPEDVSGAPRSYTIVSMLRPGADGKLSTLFLLPGPVPPNAAVSVAFPMFGVGRFAKEATLTGPGGSVTVNAKWNRRLPIAADIRASDMQRIAPNGGIVRVETDPSGFPSGVPEPTASLRVTEKTQ